MITKVKLERRIKRTMNKIDVIKSNHGNKPNETHDYYGGTLLGYWEGRLSLLEDLFDMLEELEEKHSVKETKTTDIKENDPSNSLFERILDKFDKRVPVTQVANPDDLVISNASLEQLKRGINKVYTSVNVNNPMLTENQPIKEESQETITINKLEKYLTRRLERTLYKIKTIKEEHGDKPNETHNYYGGWALGYWEGRLGVIEWLLNDVEESKELI